ncbi:MAG: patatin-like phospholipase family protein [Propionicimonas sp.]|nr:patatin-like phospholipase family protein [Propionicimonas sp.]
MAKHRRVALVLGSGGARGYAQIGVIQVLKERGYEIVAIAGTSMGALVGGLEATGKLQEYVDWATTLNQRDVLRLVDASPFGAGAIKLERVLARMSEILDGARIEELPIPYTAVATDLGARREVWFTSGPVDVAIRASVAIPGAITPIMVNGRLLVDGGVLNPVPVEPVMGVDADFTLAVALSGWTPTDFNATPARESSQSSPPAEWLDRFRRSAAGLFENEWVTSVMARFGREHAEPDPRPFEDAPPGLGIPQVAAMALDTMGAAITRYRLAALPPDLLINVPGDAAKTMDFHRAEELIELGRTLAVEALDKAFPVEEQPVLEAVPSDG